MLPLNRKGTARAPIVSGNVVLSGLKDRRRPYIVRGVPGDSARASSDNRFVMEKIA
jgi:hypothetical protein